MATTASQPLVSVITPAFNAEGFIGETIASVQAQSYPHWEMLIADDQSQDGTLALVEQLASDDPRIKPLPAEVHSGLAAHVRNRAMAAAEGDYFAFLDADDLWKPEKLARQVAHLQAHPDSRGVCCYHELVGDSERLDSLRKMLNYPSSSVVTLDECTFNCPFQTSTLLMHRSCFDEFGGMNEDPRLKNGQDYVYFCEIIKRWKVVRLREVLAGYRIHSTGQSLQDYVSKNEQIEKIFQVMREREIFSPAQLRRRRAAAWYEQAKNNLFHYHGPFRRLALQSVLTGSAPREAWVMLGLGFLPASLLKPLLLQLKATFSQR